MNNTSPTTRNRLILGLFIGTFVLLGGGLVWLISKDSSTTSPNATSTPTNSAATSIKTTPTPIDQLPKAPAQPAFIGFTTLLDQGLSDNQVGAIRYALTKFLNNRKLTSNTITLVSGTAVIAPHVIDSTSDTASYQIKLADNTSYSVRTKYMKGTAAETTVFDSAGRQIFTSGIIDLYNGDGI